MRNIAAFDGDLASDLLPSLRIRLGIADVLDITRDEALLVKISAAIRILEVESNTIIALRDVVGYADAFAQRLPLLDSLFSVTKVEYVDVNDVKTLVSASNYYVDSVSAAIVFKNSYAFPALSEAPNSVIVTYKSGFDGLTLPSTLREAIAIVVGQWEINQQAVQEGVRPMRLPYAALQLLNGYRDFREHV